MTVYPSGGDTPRQELSRAVTAMVAAGCSVQEVRDAVAKVLAAYEGYADPAMLAQVDMNLAGGE